MARFLDPVYNYSLWPWRRGPCQHPRKTFCRDSSYTWVMPCFECHKELCDNHCVDACPRCGIPRCADCSVAHNAICPQRINFGCMVESSMPSRARSLASNVRTSIKASMKCPKCTSMRDIGQTHICLLCRTPQCLNQACFSIVKSPFCQCGRLGDICYECGAADPADGLFRCHLHLLSGSQFRS